MTPAQYENFNTLEDDVNINPLMLFVILFITPYVLFFGLLMLITWQFNLALLYESVVQVGGTAYIKAWVIGTFLLAFFGALLFSGYRTKTYLSEHLLATKPQQLPTQKPMSYEHYTIEELPHDEAAVEARHLELDSVISGETSDTAST